MRSYLIQAKKYCDRNKHRFTEPRQKVLNAIVKQKAPVTAYDLLKILSINKDVKPPTIYRAIDFWSKHGFIHRVESLNAYIYCDKDHKHEGSQIAICDKCGITKEIHLDNLNISQRLKEEESFSVSNWSFEIHGMCQNCNN